METKNQEMSFLKSYNLMKSKHPDYVLLFRSGNRYESYKKDAICIGRILEIGFVMQAVDDMGTIPVASFPMADLNVNLPKLIRSGLRIAICDKN